MRRVADELAAHASGGNLTFGILSALRCVSGGISSMISSLNMAYHIRQTRSWFKVRAIALGLSMLISILLLMALFMVLVGSHFVRLGRDRASMALGDRPWIGGDSLAGCYPLR